MYTKLTVTNLLVIWADPSNLGDLPQVLDSSGYSSIYCNDADAGISKAREINFDAVLVNIGDTAAVGVDILKSLRQFSPETPVIVLGSHVTVDMTVNAIHNGVFDFIVMPSSAEHVTKSLARALRNRRQRENEKLYVREIEEKLREGITVAAIETNMDILGRLAAVAEFRDPRELSHNRRFGHYCRILSRALSLPTHMAEAIGAGGQFHDIGMSCMPNPILLKNGRLTKVEADLMKSHTVIGKQMLEGSSLPGMEIAASIALTHHERWDGSGYPGGLKGDTIPMEGRIAIICDQYDTLRSVRPYKQPLSHEVAMRIITDGDGRTMPKHFDPKVLAAFKETASSL